MWKTELLSGLIPVVYDQLCNLQPLAIMDLKYLNVGQVAGSLLAATGSTQLSIIHR
jgi:hypothetical protein